jgi:hypothetical protein
VFFSATVAYALRAVDFRVGIVKAKRAKGVVGRVKVVDSPIRAA